MSAQVKQGYKLTEVGEIPVEWCVATLGEICMFENGDRGSNYPSPNSFVTSGVPFINAGHIANGKINFGDMNYITPESFNRLGSGKVRRGDILFCLRGSIGKFGIAGDSLGDGAIASSLVIIRPKTTSINLEYLSCYFSSELCSRMIDTWSGGAAQPNLGAQDLAKFSVPLPALQAEQRAIAATLSDMDALISGLDHLIAKKRDLKQAAMQQLLTGQQRLPGFSGAWNVKQLSEISKIGRGRVISHREISNSINKEYPVYSSQTSNNGIMGYIDTHDFEGEYVTWTTDGERAGTAFHRDGKFNCTNVCGTIKLSRDNAVFLTSILRRVMPKHVSRNLANPKLMNDVVKKIEVYIPQDLSEQTAIANILSDMESELATLETRRSKARQLKQGMMQELLSGRIRLFRSSQEAT